MKTDVFQSCGHCWVFHICWHIECSTFTGSSFRIWNSLTGIPSPPLALFMVMLPKVSLRNVMQIICSYLLTIEIKHHFTYLLGHLNCVICVCVCMKYPFKALVYISVSLVGVYLTEYMKFFIHSGVPYYSNSQPLWSNSWWSEVELV